MPERQVRPFLPGGVKVITGDEPGQADEDSAAPVSQSEYDALKRRVEELESSPVSSQPLAPATIPAPESAPGSAPDSVPESATSPVMPSAPVVIKESIDIASPPRPETASPADPYEALLKRIEELEAEVQRLRESETDSAQ
jgi:tetrahydromethanopterin S-methyltransferase subunit G